MKTYLEDKLKILIVFSGNVDEKIADTHHAFVYEQINAVKSNYDIEYDVALIKGRGINGYLKNLSVLKKKIKDFNPDLVHAHYGLAGLLSVMQRKKPVIITFHGSEIKTFTVNFLSSVASFFSKYNIFVAHHIREKLYLKPRKNYQVIPCGIDLADSKVVDKELSLSKMQLDKNVINILFSGAFNDRMKNYELARESVDLITDEKINLIELKGFKREEVNYLFNACDLFLLTSKSEGSPQTIKEAMACNCPIVATDVGDIREVIAGTDGCFLTSFRPENIADNIRLAIKFSKRTNGRDRIKKFDNNPVSSQIYSIYSKVLNRKTNNFRFSYPFIYKMD